MTEKEEMIVNKTASDNVPERESEFIEILKIFSPGTSIRSALDDILRAGMGALIAIHEDALTPLMEGGFKVNCKFSPQRLVELAKMDGALILSSNLKRILYANTLLVPDSRLLTRETGTRHKAAERTAKQTGAIVIAISERKKKITLYWHDVSYILEESSEILRKAAETLQILEKQKDTFDELLIHLNILEITNTASKEDVCNILQRIEILERISNIVKRNLIELGKEGAIVSMRLKELTKNMVKEKEMILKDYFKSEYPNVESLLEGMNFDFLIETSNVIRIIFGDLQESSLTPAGWRILNRTGLPEKDISLLITHFGTLEKIFDASKEELSRLFPDGFFVDYLLRILDDLRNKILSGKKI